MFSLTELSLTKLSLTELSLTKLCLTKLCLTKLYLTMFSLTKLNLTKLSQPLPQLLSLLSSHSLFPSCSPSASLPQPLPRPLPQLPQPLHQPSPPDSRKCYPFWLPIRGGCSLWAGCPGIPVSHEKLFFGVKMFRCCEFIVFCE